jgi:hypothetical protein
LCNVEGDRLTDSKRRTPLDSIDTPQVLTLKEALIGVRLVVAKYFDFKMVAAPRTDKPLRAALRTQFQTTQIFFGSLCQSYTLISDNTIILLFRTSVRYVIIELLQFYFPFIKAVSPGQEFLSSSRHVGLLSLF